jgi:hypothetical protein
MSLTVYRDANFQGPFARIRPGFFSGRDLRGFRNRAAYDSGEDLQNAISSVRVGPNTVAALYGGLAPSASSGARVLIGPRDVPDLGALGLDDKVSAIQVVSFKAYDSGAPRSGGAVLFDGYSGQGRSAALEQGDYDSARLASEEVKFDGRSLRSIRVTPNVVAVLYAGPDFDSTDDAVVVVGPTSIDDLGRVGMLERVSSLRVLYADPLDGGPAPPATLGASRAYFPGGAFGLRPPRAGLPAGSPAGSPAGPPAGSPAGPPAGPPAGSPSPARPPGREQVAIVFLFILVAALGAYVAATARAVRKMLPPAAALHGYRA